jgi:hypothetical protein
MFNANESCSRIREFQDKMQHDLALLGKMVLDKEQLEREADRAMLEMLRWESMQKNLTPTRKVVS